MFPFYWKQITDVSALQLLGHRIVWSFVALAAIILLPNNRRRFAEAIRAPRVLRVYTIAALLISVNWFTFVWAVNNGFLVETSLGYFINPIINVLFGVVLLRERLRPLQWVAVGLASAGVLYMTASYGSLPWISLALAFSFGMYGLVKKGAPLGSIHGLTVETAVLFLPALAYLVFIAGTGQGAFLHKGARTDLLIVGTGVLTILPLLLFATAVQRVPLSLVGVIQYISPTMQLLAGVLVYKEPFTRVQLVGFGGVWAGLVVFAIDGLLTHRRSSPLPVLDEGAG